MSLVVKPLNAEDFHPYGEVLSISKEPGRQYFEEAFGNLRPNAKASLSMVCRPPIQATRQLSIQLFERHEFSSQSFIPLAAMKWLIVVCPHAQSGGPDYARSKAFLADGTQGVTYRPNTWHHGLTVLQGSGQFAVFMWRDGTSTDEEFVKVTPFDVSLGDEFRGEQ